MRIINEVSQLNNRCDVQRIKRAADLVEVVQDCVRLRKSGQEFVGLCPFHKEGTPSFHVHPGKQLYHCYGCAAGGDVIRFVMEIERISFRDALKLLGHRYAIETATVKPTRALLRTWRKEREERQLIDHFRLVEGVSEERAGIEFRNRCELDPGYRTWLEDDLTHAYAVCGLLVGMLALAQERNGDFPATREAA